MTILLTSFSEAESEICTIRNTVFGEEQNVPPEIDWDGKDGQCLHVLVLSEKGEAVATGRLAPEGKIGRLAVLRIHRGRGAGTGMLRALVEAARGQGLRQVFLHAQTQALRFYEQEGFRVRGESFHEAEIEHYYMYRHLGDNGESGPRRARPQVQGAPEPVRESPARMPGSGIRSEEEGN
ncbi:MAG: GNAT family N-acetyltransferase [Roseibacillus sp.]|nr:GNAT family N-acetyltransferase [Verrucomicrobiales bacterium]